jgi:hypothetical protein
MPQVKTIADITDGHCSCIFYPPQKKDVLQLVNRKNKRLMKLYKKRKYSQNKIDRMINQNGTSMFNLLYRPDTSLILSNILINIFDNSDSMYLFCHEHGNSLNDDANRINKDILHLSSSHLSIPVQEWLIRDRVIQID